MSPVLNSPIKPLRSRLGCKTCKIRKVKCGEEKPSCVRCSGTGRKCEYEGTISGTFSSTPSTISIQDYPLSLLPNTVWRERRAFAYYFQQAALSIGGGLDVDFWRTFVPQVCRSEPGVWDAIIAIGDLFESPRKDSRFPDQKHRDALSWYSRSVSAIRQRIERGSIDTFVGLITCILFISIEAIQGNEQEALQLYGQGVHLIRTLRAQIACGIVSTTKASFLEDAIVPIFVRLGAIALTIAHLPVSGLLLDNDSVLVQEFVSLKPAREAIARLSTEIQLLERTCIEHRHESRSSHIHPELMHRQIILSAKLNDWHTAFTILIEGLQTKGVLSPQQVGTGALLLAYYEMSFVILATCVSPSHMIYDAYIPNFQNIVEQSSIAINALAQSDGSQPPFTFEINAGFPLWFTCLRCREPKIRRMALALFRRGPQVQGFYNSAGAAALGESVMMLEEAFAIRAIQGKPESLTLDSTGPATEHHAYSPGHNSDVSNDVSSCHPVLQDSGPAAHSYLAPAGRAATTPTTLFVPEEARLGSIGIFRSQDGFPAGTKDEDVAKWNERRDQIFLRFSRNKHDQASNTWHIVHEFVPIGT
ncbi:hypothetical protein BDV36DRAFT_154859 [Aspergillus pseudocaelatus]|uniref:Zn(2)-C6 fungal-type domain-containing protein n=1 Tax=Aspergillus pseudocaelatus TaxID=1825620 RepID=A0ABQ6X193_9EURO|nr:hypothetical protein BDV36DRAFT_154859 [Aspergillus pseudocaelatus]